MTKLEMDRLNAKRKTLRSFSGLGGPKTLRETVLDRCGNLLAGLEPFHAYPETGSDDVEDIGHGDSLGKMRCCG
jgi:hypothetical protein